MRVLADGGHWSWPVVLREGDVELRPLRRSDARAWRSVRAANAAWLTPWEATHPDADASPPPTFGQMVRGFSREARAGRMLPFAVTFGGELVGQLTVSGIAWGSLRSAHAGYWVDRRVAGRGIIPTALALAVDHCFFTVGLHRVEINIRPENLPSLAVARKLGFRPEGLQTALPAHRRGLAGPRELRAHRRGRPWRAVGEVANGEGRPRR